MNVLSRIENGNFGDVKSLSLGLFERRIHFGAGYRIYFGNDGDQIVILLGGGTKRHQSKDIKRTREFWDDYKYRKKKGN